MSQDTQLCQHSTHYHVRMHCNRIVHLPGLVQQQVVRDVCHHRGVALVHLDGIPVCHDATNKARLGLRVVWVLFGLELDKVSHQRRKMTVRLHGFYCVWLLDVSQF